MFYLKLMEAEIFNLRACRVLHECRRLFFGYKNRLSQMSRLEFLGELNRYRNEVINFPNHLLTLVKGELLLSQAKRFTFDDIIQDFIKSESNRIAAEIERRRHDISN